MPMIELIMQDTYLHIYLKWTAYQLLIQPYVTVFSCDFVVQRKDRYGFAQIACDMAIEHTCNRDSKSNGGMKGLTLKKTQKQFKNYLANGRNK